MNKSQKNGIAASLRTPKSTKRNLSNTSILPSSNDVKKVFISTNRYAILDTDENNVFATITNNTMKDPDCLPLKNHNMEPLTLPIHVKNVTNFFDFKS